MTTLQHQYINLKYLLSADETSINYYLVILIRALECWLQRLQSHIRIVRRELWAKVVPCSYVGWNEKKVA